MPVELFQSPIDVSPPPGAFPTRQHPQPPINSDVQTPLQTNNTFNNLLLADQTFPAWPLPYSLWITKDGESDWGLAFNHTEKSQFVFGPDPSQNPVQFYFNPPKIKSFAYSGKGWRNVSVRTVENGKLYHTLHLSGGGSGTITVPMSYGMGFVTAIYENEIPVLHSAVGVQEFRPAGLVNNNRTAKYVARLFDQRIWSIYVSEDPGNQLVLVDPNHIETSNPSAKMVIQICKGESTTYDQACGTFPTEATLVGNVDPSSNVGKYSFSYKMSGVSSSGAGIVWCLPHQQETLSSESKRAETGLLLDSPTKGVMKAYLCNTLSMEVPNLPTDIGFQPWTSVSGFGKPNYSQSALGLIRQAAEKEVQQDVLASCDVDSMYFGGKQLDKYAYLAYVTHFVLRDSGLTQSVLPKIKQAIEKYASNHQQFPLCYDSSWKGLISTAKPDQDFGNSNYNDHHFHYGYHVHAIALVASIDPNWLHENGDLVLNYALTLIRDYANPSAKDPYFPQSRNFDWFHGHSFAHGIFPSGDGKNEESSSEDYHSIYGIKLFGKVIGDSAMEHGANLMLGIMRKSLNMYMLYSSDNTTQPSNFAANKVSGILFENKIDFATFFGRGTVGDEFIHGIHMIPITPISSYIRGARFVKEEWDQKLCTIVDRIPDGWRGILMLNYGLFDPRAAWQFFSAPNWDDRFLDGGMSRTWSLAYLAGIGGST
ncbi:putative endo-1,3(4)-beta-glucanase [Clavispora lusitaniae]|uniref:glucan endo-1,3-beta-D-glucosidase n=1 Tax=Clavispora lusitaniae TaxID=36911 RepID=A0AA91Q3B1_CLALS|nr:putative endo-1,3(4)-beta-glucanase [Clavispora lusitaniae]